MSFGCQISSGSGDWSCQIFNIHFSLLKLTFSVPTSAWKRDHTLANWNKVEYDEVGARHMLREIQRS